jgi:hypothetical protein
VIVEAVNESVEELLAGDLTLGCGVITLAPEGGPELDRGDEEGAGLADRFEVAVHLDRRAQ